jgi:hypothetical protein
MSQLRHRCDQELRVLSTRQVAERLGVTERQVQRYIHAELLEAQQFGDHPTAPWMITADSVERLLALREQEPQRFRQRIRRANAPADAKGA